VEPATRLLPWFYQLSIALVTNFHHDKIKGDMERIIMHSRVSLNSYNINAQFNDKVITVIEQKTLMGRCALVIAFAWEQC
jgi:hypothetical protein